MTGRTLDEKMFPILGNRGGDKAFVPWRLVAPHEPRAIKNHDQTLERLADRGGLSACELCAVLEDRAWRRITDEDAWRCISKHIEALALRDAGEAVGWMRVIRASGGEPVLFYIENDTDLDDHSMIHCYARFNGFDADMTLKGIPTEKVAAALAGMSQKSADAVIEQAKKFVEDEDE